MLARPAVYDLANASSVLNDARKRFEKDLMCSRQKEVENEKELRNLEQE